MHKRDTHCVKEDKFLFIDETKSNNPCAFWRQIYVENMCLLPLNSMLPGAPFTYIVQL